MTKAELVIDILFVVIILVLSFRTSALNLRVNYLLSLIQEIMNNEQKRGV